MATTRQQMAARAGARIGAYRLEERIGEGGMGEVWRVRHERLGRSAAIKIVRPEALAQSPARAEAVLARFEREARATAALSSPHTVDLFDFGRTADGSFYYVMELLEGVALDALVQREGPLEPTRVAHLLVQACDSLAEAHERGVLHRDVKPENLFLCRKGLRHDFLKVLDFGLVKEIGRTGPTRSNVVIGSPGYMAPEAVRGQRDVDARADLYSLGCVAYLLLTGQGPFDLENVMDLLIAHLNDEPAPPSELAESPLPPSLETLVMACLAKDPNARPASARALGRALRSLASQWTDDDAERWWKLHDDVGPRPIDLTPSMDADSASVDPSTPRRVLVVDDEAAVRMVIAGLLGQAGYETVPASTAAEALERLASGDIDVVLSDLRMPGQSGFELLSEVRERAPDVPVILLTAHGTVPLAVEALQAGAHDFLLKPFDRAELVRSIEGALERAV